MLEKINSPRDIKGLTLKELRALCGEIRENIISCVSESGGHLASNLGIVETTVAIHRVFDTPRDLVVFDVGHQSYAHKMLTGRYSVFGTLRRGGGISGFTNADESEYDTFTEGHSGTAISQSLGLSAASKLSHDDRYVIAVVGDGSFTNGMVYEAINNCRALGRHLIIILNDNEMSISKNVGGLPGHLTKIRTSRKYFNAKHRIKKIFSKIPLVGKYMISGARHVRDFIKRAFLAYNFFEALGVDYIGVADGCNLGKMINVLKEAKTKEICTVVHIHTKKGKGYAPAESDPEKYHSVGAFDIESGEPKKKAKGTFSAAFGDAVLKLAENDERICAVTAAMEDGTGLAPFMTKFPDRAYDVGIAEEHAVTFAAGLAKGGYRPVVALYSTFAQRTFDQVFHDVAVQHLPFTLCLDRAGLVEGDGVTHQGIFDIAELSSIPGVNIYSPDSFAELGELLEESLSNYKIDIIRYPKGAEPEYDRGAFEKHDGYSVAEYGDGEKEVCVVTYGRMTEKVVRAAEGCGVGVKVIRLSRVSPLPEGVTEELQGARGVLFVEEGIERGGVGEALGAEIAKRGAGVRYKVHAINDLVPHGKLCELFEKYGFTEDSIRRELCEVAK